MIKAVSRESLPSTSIAARFAAALLLEGLLLPAVYAATASATLTQSSAVDTKQTPTYQRLRTYLDSIPAIDTHDHIRAFTEIPGRIETDRGKGMTLYSLWKNSYYPSINKLTPWELGQSFDDWWKRARYDFDDARATGFYRYQLPAFRDLYGVDFDTITADKARRLDQQIFENYKDPKWLRHVITERANIELMIIDPTWDRLELEPAYDFTVLALRVNPLVKGFHPDEVPDPLNSPYGYAEQRGLKIANLDDYLDVIKHLFQDAVEAGIVCLKYSLAYQRTLRFEKVSKEQAGAVFGKRRSDLNDKQIKAFEDFIFWRVCELSARYDLPFQIHTGYALAPSNPLLLTSVIEANPKTNFILLHGGFPWIGETGSLVMRHGSHVWIDSVWLPTISYTMAKRAYHEWLEMVPSDRILWGGDSKHAEGIYAATVLTRQCLAEVLSEKVDRGALSEEHAHRIGRQILRENALKLFPQLRKRLWKTDQER